MWCTSFRWFRYLQKPITTYQCQAFTSAPEWVSAVSSSPFLAATNRACDVEHVMYGRVNGMQCVRETCDFAMRQQYDARKRKNEDNNAILIGAIGVGMSVDSGNRTMLLFTSQFSTRMATHRLRWWHKRRWFSSQSTWVYLYLYVSRRGHALEIAHFYFTHVLSMHT